MQMPIIVEPQTAYAARHEYAEEDAFAFTRADEHIFRQLRNGPMRLMTLINVATRLVGYASKRQKLAIRHEILMRLTTLIRRRQLRRIKRVFVGLPTAL